MGVAASFGLSLLGLFVLPVLVSGCLADGRGGVPWYEARRDPEVRVIDRPGQPFLGTGEAAQGPTAAAIANAVADATGARLRELPLTPDRVKAATSAL